MNPNENLTTQEFTAKGTTCESCARIIEKQALKVEGVKKVRFSYAKEKGNVEFDKNKTNIDEILSKIEEKGYECMILEENRTNKALAWVFGILGIAIVGYFIMKIAHSATLPQISQNMGYGLLFVVGLLTGFHCVSMCGGFVVSYTARHAQKGEKAHKSHMMYGLGKIISYTIIGAAFGLLGSIIAFTPMIRGVAGILAGLFLVIFGLNMLNIFPWLRNIRIRTPRFMSRFIGKESSKHRQPFVIGLLNGLMIACGPLQAIYIMAAGTGSMLEGAKLLFVFALGTLPVMLGFGFLTSLISGKATRRILKASGVIVIVLGLIMINRGVSLTGTGLDTSSIVSSVTADSNELAGNAAEISGDYQVIRMDVTSEGWEPDRFVLKKGVPVRWIINGKEINGCNNAIQVPRYGLSFDIKPGEQVIEFTPDEEGVVSWSCWMGMIPGTFIVKEDINLDDAKQIQKELESAPEPVGGSCGCGG